MLKTNAYIHACMHAYIHTHTVLHQKYLFLSCVIRMVLTSSTTRHASTHTSPSPTTHLCNSNARNAAASFNPATTTVHLTKSVRHAASLLYKRTSFCSARSGFLMGPRTRYAQGVSVCVSIFLCKSVTSSAMLSRNGSFTC